MDEKTTNYKSKDNNFEKQINRDNESPSNRAKWLGKMHPLPPPRMIQGKLKELFPEMDNPKYQRAIGMMTAVLLALDESERRGVLSYQGHLYPCVFAHRKFMQQFGDKIGQEVSIGVWPTLYARLPQPDGRKKKTLIFIVKQLKRK